MSDLELEKLVKASEKLLQAAKKTYGTKGLALSELLVAINYYELTRAEIDATLEQELKDFENYFKQN